MKDKIDLLKRMTEHDGLSPAPARRESAFARRFSGGCKIFVFLLPLCLAIAVFGQKTPDREKPAKETKTTPAPSANRFRVTMTGFTVNRQTNDNIFEADGKGDEVFVLAEVAQYDSYWLYDRQ